jgi:DNA-directed RNA polymerase specialized sigma24 family protein
MRREIPNDLTEMRRERRRPVTPIQALMECAPGEEPDVSRMEMIAYKEIIADAIDRLDLRHKWVFEQNVIHRVPVRTLGHMMGLGKTYVWMLKNEALEMLRKDLQDHPLIVAYLRRHDMNEDT